MNYKKQLIHLISLIVLFLSIIIGLVVFVDPFFHYHKPLERFNYHLGEPRYYNDGIAKHFDYNAVITGSSMIRTFKTSEIDERWGTNAIKLSYSGPSFKEIGDNLKYAFAENSNIEMIIMPIDGDRIDDEKDYYLYKDIPFYLYDDNLINDVSYVLNKTIILEEIYQVYQNTKNDIKMESFDEYHMWPSIDIYGKEAVMNDYDRNDIKSEKNYKLTESMMNNIDGNLGQNVIEIVKDNPNTDFYLFYPPYSIAWFDRAYMTGYLEKEIEMFKYATELLLEYDNVYLYSFFSEYEMISEFNNYRDVTHYQPHINTLILDWMYTGEHLLTKDNYEEYFEEIGEFYQNYDYDSLW